jgi:beta-mannosidase
MKNAACIRLQWQIGWTVDPAQAPARFVSATVPGAVQLDWARAEGWPPYWYADNFRHYDWMAEKFRVYRTTLPRVKLAVEERLFFVSHGVDYACEVRINGAPCHGRAGMHTPFEIELTADAATGGTLEVVVFPAPPGEAQPLTQHLPRTDCKPPVAYVAGHGRVRLVMREEGWGGGNCPVTQADPPTTFEINGRRIFAKGANGHIGF